MPASSIHLQGVNLLSLTPLPLRDCPQSLTLNQDQLRSIGFLKALVISSRINFQRRLRISMMDFCLQVDKWHQREIHLKGAFYQLVIRLHQRWCFLLEQIQQLLKITIHPLHSSRIPMMHRLLKHNIAKWIYLGVHPSVHLQGFIMPLINRALHFHLIKRQSQRDHSEGWVTLCTHHRLTSSTS